ATPELMLEPGELVVEGRRARDSQPARRHRELVRPVRAGDAELPAPGPAPERPRAAHERPRLAEPRAAAVAADHLRLDAVQLEELKRLGVLAGRDLDLVAATPEQLDERPEHEHVRRGC